MKAIELQKHLGDKRAAILKNHGLLTTGETVDAAVWGFLSMDRCCQSQLIAESVGQMERISDDVAELTKKPSRIRTRYVGYVPTPIRSDVRKRRQFFKTSFFSLSLYLARASSTCQRVSLPK